MPSHLEVGTGRLGHGLKDVGVRAVQEILGDKGWQKHRADRAGAVDKGACKCVLKDAGRWRGAVWDGTAARLSSAAAAQTLMAFGAACKQTTYVRKFARTQSISAS